MCATQLIFQGFVGVALVLRVRKMHRQAVVHGSTS
jgi:hypothetical protein